VTTGTATPVALLLLGSTTVLTSPPVETAGVYYVTASVTASLPILTTVTCQITGAIDPASATVGPSPSLMSLNLALTGAVNLTAGDTVSIACTQSGLIATIQNSSLTAILVDSSNAGVSPLTARAHHASRPKKATKH
jgi:hypothetical protein